MCTLLWDLWGETNNRVFKSVDRGPSEIWSLVFFYALTFFHFFSIKSVVSILKNAF